MKEHACITSMLDECYVDVFLDLDHISSAWIQQYWFNFTFHFPIGNTHSFFRLSRMELVDTDVGQIAMEFGV